MKGKRIRYMQVASILLCVTAFLNAQELASEAELFTGKEFSSAFADPVDNPELPNVLLIGDSISIGYTVAVRKQLQGKADVFRIPGNGKDSSYGLENLDTWTGTRHWDVIHFNWGLWDLCYRHPESKVQGHRDKVNGSLTTTPDQYRVNLERIVARLNESGATLVWCTTTPVPEFEAGRKLGDDILYNRIAAAVMKANGVRIDDLHAHALQRVPEIHRQKGDVHFTETGYQFLSEKVADSLLDALSDRDQPPKPDF